MLQNFPRQLFHHEGGVGWYDETKNDDYGSITHLCEIDGDDNDEVGDGDGGDYDALAMMKKVWKSPIGAAGYLGVGYLHLLSCVRGRI